MTDYVIINVKKRDFTINVRITDYVIINVKKRDFTINVRMSDTATNAEVISMDETRIARNGDTRIARNGDTRVSKKYVTGYPRYIKAKKRNFVVGAEVNHG